MLESLQSMCALFFFFFFNDSDSGCPVAGFPVWNGQAHRSGMFQTHLHSLQRTELVWSSLLTLITLLETASFFFFFWSLTRQTGQIMNGASHHPLLFSLLFLSSQGLLSFLSAPLIGALSDVWGRKSFLLLTVFFTCAPIPLMKISPWWEKH